MLNRSIRYQQCVCVCVCVCERERERERDQHLKSYFVLPEREREKLHITYPTIIPVIRS